MVTNDGILAHKLCMLFISSFHRSKRNGANLRSFIFVIRINLLIEVTMPQILHQKEEFNFAVMVKVAGKMDVFSEIRSMVICEMENYHVLFCLTSNKHLKYS